MLVEVILVISFIAVKVVGTFALALGSLHFFFPRLLDFESVLKMDGADLKPFRAYIWNYQTKRTDVRGIIWLMNHHVSFVIVSIGVADLLVEHWISSPFSHILLVWMSLWWLLRAFLQFYLGRRRGDWFVFAWFIVIAILQGLPVLL
jgi:hypothetical protein